VAEKNIQVEEQQNMREEKKKKVKGNGRGM